jgi:hypothetical protein
LFFIIIIIINVIFIIVVVTERRDTRTKYVYLFKQQTVKKDPKLHKTELALLERQLSFDDIVLYRKITRIQIKREEIIDKAAKNSGVKKGASSFLKKFKIKSKDSKEKDSQITLTDVQTLKVQCFFFFSSSLN